MRGLLVVVVVALTVGCSTEPVATPASTSPAPDTSSTPQGSPPSIGPSTSPPETATSAPEVQPVVPEGYERVRATVTEPDGAVCELCLWLADTADTRRQGLMFVTDLGAADGMAFVYPEPHSGTFWMKNTLLPLSIAFFAADGSFLDGFDMEPCTDEPCRQYPTADDFVVAIETTQGDLAELGIVPGSVLDLTDLPCD